MQAWPKQQTNAGRGAAERAGGVPLHGRPHQLKTGRLARLDRQGMRASLFTERGEEAARVFQQGQWALAGRALRNPSAACPYGSHQQGLTQGSLLSPLASGHL